MNTDTYKWKALIVVALGSLMGTMDFGIANISFPILTKAFNADISTVMWVTLIYGLINLCLMLIMGKVSDNIGKKKVYTMGLCIFSLGMLLCSLSQTISHLIAFRSIQAVGSAMIVACGPAIIADAFPEKELGKGMGIMQASVSFGFIIGPVLGGFLLEWLDWRSIYYTRVPLALIVFFLALSLLKKDSPKTNNFRFDFIGTITSSSGFFFIIYGVSRISRLGIGSTMVHLLISIGILLLIFFIYTETRVKDPILDLGLFKNRAFSYSTLALFFTFLAIPAYMLLMPFYLIEGIKLSSGNAGLLMSVTAIVSALVSPLSGTLSDRFGAIRFSVLGAVLTLIAFVFILGFDLQTTVISIVFVLFLLGIATGTFQTANNSAIMKEVPRNRLGTAAALIATKRNVGLSLGMALAGTIYSAKTAFHETELISRGMDAAEAAISSIPLSFQNAIMISIIFHIIVILFTSFAYFSKQRQFKVKGVVSR